MEAICRTLQYLSKLDAKIIRTPSDNRIAADLRGLQQRDGYDESEKKKPTFFSGLCGCFLRLNATAPAAHAEMPMMAGSDIMSWTFQMLARPCLCGGPCLITIHFKTFLKLRC
jgi:hypothetical protein